MKKKTITIDDITELYLKLIRDAVGTNASEIIRRAVDMYYFDVKKNWPSAMQDAINKYRVSEGMPPLECDADDM